MNDAIRRRLSREHNQALDQFRDRLATERGVLPWDVSDEEAIAWLCHYALGDPRLLDDAREFDWDWRHCYEPTTCD